MKGSNRSEGQYTIEVLVNSPGPHDRIRIVEPYCMMQKIGQECRFHRFPVRLEDIRKGSIVVWQRPKPETVEDQLRYVEWFRENGCVLLTEWDDHPGLFPESIRSSIEETGMAALRYCHGILTSSSVLAEVLSKYNRNTYVMENLVKRVPALDIEKHKRKNIRIFLGNQNRGREHEAIMKDLKMLSRSEGVTLVIVGDKRTAEALADGSMEYHHLLDYNKYRRLMGSCQIALMPLMYSIENRCKTQIKWLEAASESTFSIGGPELYQHSFEDSRYGAWLSEIDELGRVVLKVIEEKERRIQVVMKAYSHVKKEYRLKDRINERIGVFDGIWGSRKRLDTDLQERIAQAC